MAENIVETFRVLVVSRESAVLRPLWSIAENNAWQVESAVSAWDAMERMHSSVAPHVFLLDVPRGDGDTLHILRWMRRLRPDLPVIVICCGEDSGHRREAIRLGAQEVLIRPFDEQRLESAIRRHLEPVQNEPPDVASEDVEQLGSEMFFVSAGPAAQKLRVQAELLAEADVPVLILGESGSGKDTVARLIHKLSVRSGFRFVKVNCADMPGELLEAELFGSEGTSSPSSNTPTSGKLQRTEGTLFLDEIAEMPLGLQARLMQVLQDKLLVKPNREKAVRVDVRILASTSHSIERALAERKLREDLYYRLSAFTVQVPALRQRKNEIAVLLRHLMHKLARHYGLPPREYSSAVFDACQQYSWPGNLKELEAFVKRYLLAGDQQLGFVDLQPTLVPGPYGAQGSDTPKLPGSYENANDIEEPHARPKSLKSLIQNVKCEAERNAISTALRKTGWNRKAAARLLQVSYRTLLYKIEEYQMTASEPFLSPASDKLAYQVAKGSGKAS